MRDATPELQDAVAQARTKLFRELAQFFSSDGMIPASDPYVLAATDALIAAVRAECAQEAVNVLARLSQVPMRSLSPEEMAVLMFANKAIQGVSRISEPPEQTP